ncbi:MAG TPA: Zn-dependent hydrolase, partial [Clostridiaceae bacterium]|nr:Zn-dependent hydrolase [Clostridiaceae bacterium]
NWIKKYNLKIPVKVVAFRCEESSAFGRATIGSSLSTGSIKDSELAKLKNVNG